MYGPRFFPPDAADSADFQQASIGGVTVHVKTTGQLGQEAIGFCTLLEIFKQPHLRLVSYTRFFTRVTQIIYVY